LGERLLCKQEVIGSIPFTSTKFRRGAAKFALRSAKRGGGLLATEFKRQRMGTVRRRLVFQPKAVSIFNNSEEAKRINSANVSARG
jgi:hypothetical protein